MSTRINRLLQKRNKLQVSNLAAVSVINHELQEIYNKAFDDNADLQKALASLEASNKYSSDDCGIFQWIGFLFPEPSPFDKNAREFLEVYLSDRGVKVDWEHNALMMNLGGCIVINDDGDVLDDDSGKWIVSRKDYETEKQRNELIEAWMEKNGYFPGVFTEDRHGNVFPVNTKAVQS